jgi:hypothetical protein
VHLFQWLAMMIRLEDPNVGLGGINLMSQR